MCRQHMRTARSEDGSPRDGNQQLGWTDTFWLDSDNPPGRLACGVISTVHNPGVSGGGAGHRLLVTWHPASAAFGPEALRPLLQRYGPIKALESVQDPAAGQTPGRATVTYVTEQAAVAAVAQLGQGGLGQQQLPPWLHSIQVQYVHQAQEPLPAQSESGQLQATAQQQQQQQLLGQQYASACVPMQLQANEPYASLQQQHQLAEQERPEGSQQQQQPEEVEAAEQPARQRHTLFFAKVPRSASRSALLELFSSFGEVVDINLFAEYPDAPVSKGCGLVTFADRAVALTVLQQLGGRYTWNGMRSPMVLKLMNPDQRKQQQQQQHRGPSTARSSSSSSAQQSRSGMCPPCSYYHKQAAAGHQGLRVPLPPPAGAASLGSTRQQQQPNLDHLPSGCSGDAYKLFVGNIPKSCSAATLRQLFERIGPVAEVVIIRDRSTSESKGSAFVWFNRAMHADQAIAQLNMRVILAGWQPSDSAHSRPLVVKRASQQWRCQLPPGEQVIAPHGTGDSSGSSKLVDTAAAAAAAVGVSGSEPAAVSVSAEEGAVVTKLPVLLQRPPPPALILAEAAPTGVTAPAPSAAAAARPVTGADLLLVPAYASTMGTVQQQQQQQHQIGYPQQQRSQALQQQPALMQQQIPAEHQILWRRQQQLPLTAMMQQVLLPQQQQQQQQQQPGSQHAAFQPVATLSSQLGAMQLQPQQQEALGILGSNHQLMKAQQQQQQQQVLPGGAIPHAGVTHPLLPDYTLVASSAAAAAGTSLVLGAQQQGMILHAPRDPGSGQLIQQPQVQGYGLANVQGNLQTSRPGIKLAVQTNQPLLVQQHGIGGVQGYSQAGQVAAPTVQGYGMPGNLQLPVQGYTPSSQAAAAAAGVQGYGMPVPSMQANFQVAAQGYTRGLPVMASAVQGYVVPGVQGHPQLGVLGLATSAGVGAAPSTEGQLARLGPFGM